MANTAATDTPAVTLRMRSQPWARVSHGQLDDQQRGQRGQDRLGAGLRVIPVPIDGVEMPTAASLPPSIAGLADLNAMPLRADSVHHDLAMLASSIEQERRRRSGREG